MSLYCGCKTKAKSGIRVVHVGVDLRSVMSPLLFVTVLDAITENEKEGLINKTVYADDLVLMSEIMEKLRETFLKWEETFEGKRLKINLKKPKMMVSVRKRSAQVQSPSNCQVRKERDEKFSAVHKMW